MLNSIVAVLMKLFFPYEYNNFFLIFYYSRGSSSSGRLTAEMLKSPSAVLQFQNMRLIEERAAANEALQQSSSTAEFPSLDSSRSSSRNSTRELQAPRSMTVAQVLDAHRQKRLMEA